MGRAKDPPPTCQVQAWEKEAILPRGALVLGKTQPAPGWGPEKEQDQGARHVRTRSRLLCSWTGPQRPEEPKQKQPEKKGLRQGCRRSKCGFDRLSTSLGQ